MPYRDIVVASVPLTALCAPPVLVPDVVAEGHVVPDDLLAFRLVGTTFGNVVLLLRTLKVAMRL